MLTNMGIYMYIPVFIFMSMNSPAQMTMIDTMIRNTIPTTTRRCIHQSEDNTVCLDMYDDCMNQHLPPRDVDEPGEGVLLYDDLGTASPDDSVSREHTIKHTTQS